MKSVFFLLFLIPTFVFAQKTEQQVRFMAKTATEPELIIESSSLILESRLYQAAIIVDKLLELKPNNANYNYRKGLLLLNSNLDYRLATKYFLKALPHADKDYDFFSITDTTCSNNVYYYLANCYHLDEQILKAKEYYKLALNIIDRNSSPDIIKQTELGLQQCEVALNLIKYPKKVKINNLGNVVNTEFPEYSPVISLDGEALYFTSRRPWANGETEQFRDPLLHNFPEDIYVSYRDTNQEKIWSEPIRLDFCEAQRNEATIAVSPDERRIYVYQDNTGGGDIFYSDMKSNKFQQVKSLDNQNVNTKNWETHCTTTTDGLNMYFVSDRPGGMGGRDIYRIVKMADGSWSEPKNLGAPINTPFDEDSPYIGADNKTLYYSSNGPASMGGFDIFITIRDNENKWSIPINLGYPINGTGDDIFFTTTIDGKRGYFSSFRKNGQGEKDIYEIENDELGLKNIASLRGLIRTAYNKPLPELTLVLKCIDCSDTTTKRIYPKQRNASFFQTLEPCRTYQLTCSLVETGNQFHKETFSTRCDVDYDEVYRELLFDVDNLRFVTPNDTVGLTYEQFKKNESKKSDIVINENETARVKVGTDLTSVIEINPIYFDLDKYNIRPDAAEELDKIVTILNNNPKMVIELGSHTDCRGTRGYNMNLSSNRAKSSIEYIRSRITNPKRVNGKGYGETKLKNKCECEHNVVSTCSEAEHQLNRRTEFIIIKMK